MKIPSLFQNGWISKKVKAIPQQIRYLFILFVILTVVFVVGRRLLIPKTFGEYGHYRAAAVDLNMEIEPKYAGYLICAECHDDVARSKSQFPHQYVACETCHGPGNAHIQAPDEQDMVIPANREFCLLCHDYNPSRPTGFPQIDSKTHNTTAHCIECHNPHTPQLPHVPGDCSACHSEIAQTKNASLHEMLPCTRCHEAMEEHRIRPKDFLPTVPKNREHCGGCHAENADSAAEIPRIDMAEHGGNYVCWQCHYPHDPEVNR